MLLLLFGCFETPWTVACQGSLSFTIFWSLLKLMSIELVMLTNHLILCLPILFLPSIFPSITVFSNKELLRIWWPRYKTSASVLVSNEHSGLISFRIDWFYLLTVQVTLRSFFQLHSSKYHFFGAHPSLWSNSHIHT